MLETPVTLEILVFPDILDQRDLQVSQVAMEQRAKWVPPDQVDVLDTWEYPDLTDSRDKRENEEKLLIWLLD